jgi:hypothetical protein
MADLTPAAQAALSAVREICPAPADEIAVAALYAAAHYLTHDRSQLAAIATELENHR